METIRPFSSIRGKIKILLLALPDLHYFRQLERILALRRVLPGHTGLLIWCNSAAIQQEAAGWLAERGLEPEQGGFEDTLPAAFHCLLLAPSDANTLLRYSHWARDPFVWKWDQAGKLTLLGSVDAKNEDGLWGLLHLSRLKIEGLEPLEFNNRAIPVAGGNYMFDEDFVLAGAKQLLDGNSDKGPEPVLNAMNGPDGRQFTRLIKVGANAGSEPVKLVHLDLYMSLTGARPNGRYMLLVGRCELIGAAGDPHPDLVQNIQSMNDYLDAISEDLSANHGFEVLRNPIPVLQKQDTADSYLCAYNNCLTEVTEGNTPVVWLTQLSFEQEGQVYFSRLRELEAENIRLWESLGFEVRLVAADFHSILDDQGSLHCITNEILRG